MMKRFISLALVLGLIGGALALPASAKKKKKAAKPVAHTLFMDGTSNVGEEDMSANIYQKLQPDEGTGEKSKGFWGVASSPHPGCAGNVWLPVFVGPVAGRVVGDLKVTFDAASTPGNAVQIRVWPDINSQLCDAEYVEPAGVVDVPLPAGAGTVEATIKDLDFTATALMMVQINPVGIPPGYARVFYGTGNSKVEFTCIPAQGSSCI